MNGVSNASSRPIRPSSVMSQPLGGSRSSAIAIGNASEALSLVEGFSPADVARHHLRDVDGRPEPCRFLRENSVSLVLERKSALVA